MSASTCASVDWPGTSPRPSYEAHAASMAANAAEKLIFHNFKILGDVRHLSQHDGRGAVFFVRQTDGVLDQVALEGAAAHHEMHVDAGEDFRIDLGALRRQPHLAAGDVLSAFLENHH